MRFHRKTYRRHWYSRRRRRRNYVPLLTILALGIIVLFLASKFFNALFSTDTIESASAALEISQGRVEFSLSNNEDQWVAAYPEMNMKFISGDRIRTKGASQASLTILGDNVLFLGENSELKIVELEQKSSGRKTIELELLQGTLWSHVSGDSFREDSKSEFLLRTPRIQLNVRGTIFALSSDQTRDVVRLIKGNIDVDLLSAKGKAEENVEVGVGQQLVVDANTLSQVQNGEEVLDIIDASFIESEWHIQNLEQFLPQEAAQIRQRLKTTNPTTTSQPSASEGLLAPGELESPTILSPTEGERFGPDLDAIKIEGTAPAEAMQITVNGYTLTRYQPGDRKWTYFGAQRFGTLVPGENTYEIVAISRDGKKSAPVKLTIYSDLPGGTETGAPQSSPSAGLVSNASDESFPAPVITAPVIVDPGRPYETTEGILDIRGLVDPATEAVEVNGYRLKKFDPNQTVFEYKINANYGNMERGENTYRIVAIGPEGKTSSTSLTILYTPAP